MSGYGDKPFGMRDLKLTNLSGTVQVDLPAAMTLKFKERVVSGELKGDDAVKAVRTFAEAAEWEIEAGGLSLEAYALITGREVDEDGVTPVRTSTLTGSAGDCFPYFKIYGKSLGECSDDIHCILYKCKLTDALEGSFANGAFFATGVKGVAVDDDTNGIFDFVQNETAADLPAS